MDLDDLLEAMTERLTRLAARVDDLERLEVGVSSAVRSGEIAMYGSATPPTGWLVCDGTAVSRATYATLFAVIGVAFGAGDGVTTFNLPDFSGVFPRGGTPGASGGADTVTLIEDNLPAHKHTLRVSDETADERGPVGAVAGWEAAGSTFVYRLEDGPNADAHPDAITETGDDTAFSILPTYVQVNFIIKT